MDLQDDALESLDSKVSDAKEEMQLNFDQLQHSLEKRYEVTINYVFCFPLLVVVGSGDESDGVDCGQ